MSDYDTELIVKCKALYAAMQSEAKETPEGIIWIGPLSTLLNEVAEVIGTSANYSQVVGALVDMDCIDQIRKGGGRAPSVWRLLREPSMSIAHLISRTRNNPGSTRSELVDQRISDLGSQLINLRKDVNRILEFLNTKYKADLESGEVE